MSWEKQQFEPMQDLMSGDASVRKQRAARWAAGLFLFGGLASTLAAFLIADTWEEGLLRFLFAVVVFAIAVGLWRLPWPRWPLWYQLAVAPAAFLMIVLHEWLVGFTAYIYPLTFVLVYVWVGLALPRWAPWALSPLLVLTFVLPKLDEPAALQAGMIALPTCLLVGEAISVAMNRLRRYRDEITYRAEVFHRVAQAARQISSLDSRALLDEVVTACRQLGFEVACMMRLLPDDEKVEMTRVSGMPESVQGQLFSLENGLVGEVRRKNAAVIWTRQAIAGQACDILRDSGLAAVYAEPIWLGEHMSAVLLVGHYHSSAISMDERAAVEILALEAGAALSNAERFDSERRQSMTYRDQSMKDPLTGLGNRRLMDHLMEALGPDDAVLVIDLDHFKWVNDEFGHDRGDEVLVSLSDFLREHLREGDMAIRLGGEEFAVIMPSAGQHAEGAAHRLLERWRESQPVTTFSLGLAIHHSAFTPAQTLKRADEALYAAKRGGRNQLVLAR